MANNKWLYLQLFGGEGAGEGGEGGASSVDNSVDDGQQALLDLGVPKDKIRKRAYKNATPSKTAPKAQEEAPQTTEQVASAENPTEETKTDDAKPKYNWDEIKEDPDINKHLQEMIQARLKNVKRSDEILTKLAPAFEVLARKYDLDADNLDFDALGDAINNDDDHYEDLALERGDTVENVKAKDIQARNEAREQKTLEQQRFQEHIQSMEQQGEALKALYPNFNLRQELQNPIFARMTAPGKGIMSVKDAYEAVHRQEIEAAKNEVIAQNVAKKISNSIQAGQRRPAENGTSSQAPSVTTFDYRNMSREQREALKARIRRGEKVVPGSEF
jgi:hypothetical protein